MTISEIIDSKIYVSPNGLFKFPAPGELIEPFYEHTESLDGDYHVSVQNEVRNENDDNTQNVAYPRVLIEKRLRDGYDEKSNYTIGFLYAMDLQTPIVKAYFGDMASACLNLSIFRASDIISKPLNSDTEPVYSFIKQASVLLDEYVEKYNEIQSYLAQTMYSSTRVNVMLGDMLRKASFKNSVIPTSTIVGAAKLLEDKKSRYRIENDQISAYDLYQCLTHTFNQSNEIISKPEKAYQIYKLMRN